MEEVRSIPESEEESVTTIQYLEGEDVGKDGYVVIAKTVDDQGRVIKEQHFDNARCFVLDIKDAFSVFGEDGMGDADLIHPKGKAEEEDAVDFILDTIKEDPGEVEIIALGPATNIARAIDKDPETMQDVKMIWSMGTAGLGVGNASPVAEFNVYADAPAYKVMLDSGLPITIIGLDMCGGEAMWTDEQFEELTGYRHLPRKLHHGGGRELRRSHFLSGRVHLRCDR